MCQTLEKSRKLPEPYFHSLQIKTVRSTSQDSNVCKTALHTAALCINVRYSRLFLYNFILNF